MKLKVKKYKVIFGNTSYEFFVTSLRVKHKEKIPVKKPTNLNTKNHRLQTTD